MLKVAEALAGEAGKSLWLRLLSPAFAFCVLGWLAVSGSLRDADHLLDAWDRLGSAYQNGRIFVVLALLLFAMAVFGWLVQALTLPVLRLLEGYWPEWLGVRQACTERQRRLFQRDRTRWGVLEAKKPLDDRERRERIRLDFKLRRFPIEARMMPTRLGNILCNAETRPIDKYGLDTVSCWPSLWLLMPKEDRELIGSARAALDEGARLFLWCVLCLVWAPWVWWIVPVALLGAALSHWALSASARDYADLVLAAFDVRRLQLYDALGWPKPKTPAEERQIGETLSRYLLRGSDAVTPVFTFNKPPAPEPPAQLTVERLEVTVTEIVGVSGLARAGE